MGFPVVMGAQCMCTMGLNPTPLMVLPDKMILTENKPMANIFDNKPMVNIIPFGTCKLLQSPGGPLPCVPATVAPWAPGNPQVLVKGKPALNNSSKLMCSIGGLISILNPGTAKTTMR